MNTLITNSTESAQEEATAETHVGSLSKKTANDLSHILSGHASPKGTKTPAELMKMDAPHGFSKKTKLNELLEKHKWDINYIVIYGYYENFPKYGLKKPFIDEWTLLVETAQQQADLKNKPVKAKNPNPQHYLNIDVDSSWYQIHTGRKNSRKPNLDQLDGNWN